MVIAHLLQLGLAFGLIRLDEVFTEKIELRCINILQVFMFIFWTTLLKFWWMCQNLTISTLVIYIQLYTYIMWTYFEENESF